MYDLIITMKFFIQAKHLIVTALLFSAFFSFVLPVNVRAAEDDVFYPGLGRVGEQLSMRYWAKTFIIGSSVDIALAIACGGENDKEKVWGTADGPQGCVPPLDEYTANLQGDSPRITGGLASMGAMAMDYSVTEPTIPTNMALFMDDTFGDTIFSTDSYAQTNWSEPNEFFQAATFTLWRTSRNISLGLLGVLLGVAGLSILFRSKLSPQVTVTVANVLPYLPISIIGIVLSYPIMAVVFNLLNPLLSIAWAIGGQVVIDLSAGAVDTSRGIYYMVGQVFVAILDHSNWSGLPLVGTTISFALALVMLTGIFLSLVAVLRFIFEYAKTIVMFVFYVIAFPIVSAVAILPGKQNLFAFLFKKVAANLLALPIMTLLVLVGLGFIASMGVSTASGSFDALSGSMSYFAMGGGIFSGIIRFAIGWGIVWQAFKVRKTLEGALGADGNLMSNFKGAPAGGPPGKK